MKRYLIFLFIIIGLAACETDSECRQTETIRCVVVFSCDSLVSNEDTIYIATFTNIDSVTVQGVGTDSVLYKNKKSVSKLSLPLRSDTTETRYHLTLNEQEDTLVILHTNNEYFVSLACGCFVFHELDTAFGTNGLIQNSQVINTAVQNTEQDNIRLYISF